MGLLDRLLPRTDPAAEQRYRALLEEATQGQPSALAELRALSAAGGVPERHRRKLNVTAVRDMADRVLADEVMTIEEERMFLNLVEGLGFQQEDLEGSTFRDGLMKQVVLARANDGRLPVAESSQLISQRDEVVHGELSAALVKEVAVREYRGGGAGVSFRIAKGVRLHSGQTRGRSVVVGSEMQTVDKGVLAITNQRAVFIGSRKTVESKYAKFIALQVYTDAISIGVSNRQNASVFRVQDGPFTAALINAAAQQSL